MDVTAAPKWGCGLRAPKIVVPASFYNMLPKPSTSTGPTATGEANDDGNKEGRERWEDFLAVRPAIRRAPAWTRVAVVTPRGVIMKQIGMLVRSALAKSANGANLSDEDGMPIRRVRRALEADNVRLNWRDAPESKAAPASQAVMMNFIMNAKVDVANSYLAAHACNMLSNIPETLRPDDNATVQRKRRLNTAFDYGQDRAQCGNFFLRTLPNIIPLIAMAQLKGQLQIDVKTASFAETATTLQQMRRDPRQRLAQYGAPDLSDVKDLTEPESPTSPKAEMRPPVPNSQGSSPMKKRSKLTTPMRNAVRRISEGMVKLMPKSSPTTRASPTKSASPATTLSMSAAKMALSPQSNKSLSPTPSLKSAREFQFPEPETSPTRTFRVPSESSGSVSSSPTAGSPNEPQSPAERPTPQNYTRPVAPTPSRWNRVEPNTPLGASTPTQASPGLRNIEFDLMAAIPEGTPRAPVSSIDLLSPMNFDFGATSTSFSSSVMLDSPDQANEARRTKNLNKARRRQSEPFVKSLLRSQARRSSISPQKEKSQAVSRKSLPAPALSPLSFERKVGKKPMRASMDATITSDMSMNESAQSPLGYFQDATDTNVSDHTLAMTRKAFPGTVDHHHVTPSRDVYNVDVRRNPDIFSYQPATSPASSISPESIDQLAKMAEDRCNGHAKVVVVQEDNRLFVRFKLPAKYAPMFPESQGRHESNFSMSPSISNSPRINFKGHQMQSGDVTETPATDNRLRNSLASPNPTALGYTPTRVAASSPLKQLSSVRTPAEETAVNADRFDDSLPSFPNFTALERTPTHLAQSSPLKPLDSIQESAEPTSSPPQSPSTACLDKTLIVSDFGNSISEYQSPIQAARSTHIAETTAPAQDSPIQSSTSTLTHVESTPSLPGSSPTKEPSPTQNLPSIDKQAEQPNLPLMENPPPISRPNVYGQSQASPSTSANELFSTINTPSVRAASAKSSSPPTAIHHGEVSSQPADNNSQSAATPERTTSAMPAATENSSIVGSPTLVTSFTPVNQSPTGRISATGSPNSHQPEVTNAAASTHGTHNTPPAAAMSSSAMADTKSAAAEVLAQDDDSPGRDYLRNFLRKNKPKRQSTTETGSPIALPAKRNPLGAKSPNTASPARTKRKLETEAQDAQSPVKNATEHASKKVRRPKSTKPRAESKEAEEQAAPALTPEAATEVADTADTVEDDAEMDSTARRSTRLRNHAPAVPKSSIPTAIKLGRSGGRGPGLNSASRSEQHDVTTQTRTNTRKNRGNAEYPAQVLEKYPKRQEEETSDRDSSESSDKARKRVGWKDPLESHHEEKPEKPKRGKGVAKATLGNSGIAKPAKTGPQRQRTSKLAETLGMAGNGTPAKPQRMTRSRTRTEA